MPIQSGDIQLLESDTMSDADEGGGAMTSNVIVDGASNNIFEDISTLDRVYGAVKFRKVFPAINIQTQDKYFGAHLIISKLPTDEKIGINMFNSKNWFDRRPEAQSRVENYRAKGAKYNGYLWDTQWSGGKVVTLFQNESAKIPGVGDVIYLTQVEDTENQFIKIKTQTNEVLAFTDTSGTYYRRIVYLTITEGLKYDFYGLDMSRFDIIVDPSGGYADIRTTVVANAAKYYSARYMDTAASNSDSEIYVDSVYSQVIPSSLTELAILDEGVAIESSLILDASNSALNSGVVSFDIAFDIAANSLLHLSRPCFPGSLSIGVSGGTIYDSGGEVKILAVVIGEINYTSGIIKFAADASTYTGTKTVSFKPGATLALSSDTSSAAVTAANRSYIWNWNIQPLPEPGSVEVHYMALGEWYSLKDNGAGAILAEEDGIGTGTVNYLTGTVSVTLAALPDVDSEVMFSWGKKSTLVNRASEAVEPVSYTKQLANDAIAPGTLVITWNDGVARTATADAQGVISGDAVGSIRHGLGLLDFSPNYTPTGVTEFTVDYDQGNALLTEFGQLAREGDGTLLIDVGYANILANSIEIEWNVKFDELIFKDTLEATSMAASQAIFRRDDGSGAVTAVPGSIVDYVAGTIQWDPDVLNTVKVSKPIYVPAAPVPPAIVTENISTPTPDYTNEERVDDTYCVKNYRGFCGAISA